MPISKCEFSCGINPFKLRKLAGDKIFMLMIMLVAIGIVLAIAFAVLKKACPASVASCNTFINSVLKCTPAA